MNPILYCIEGHWHEADDDPSVEPSVEPLLQMLHRRGSWRYVRRDAATAGELFYWMNNEWSACSKCKILYFATHGAEGEIHLGSEERSSTVPIEKLAEINCSGCLVHFSGCSILSCGEDRVRFFMEKSGAAAVSGYRADVGWTSRSWPPAALCDLMLFSMIIEEGILLDGRSKPRLRTVTEELQNRFGDCCFDLYI